ncbi:MAG TPA: response regulator transcription factor [Symbiobacteriaceae bacterium]|nr:response regulator transcription factor [Symbiobacteriaceae bacterium]
MKRAKILIVDDEPRMRELTRLYLQSRFTVVEAGDGLAALRSLLTDHPDLILLDVMMPVLDGWETLRRVRQQSTVPVVMLTARGEVPDRVQGLRMGADDYIAKPFDGRELAARLDAVLRRTGAHSAVQTIIRRGNLVLHTAEWSVSWKGRPITLTPREFELLTVLATHPGQVWSRDKLLERIWSADYEGDNRTVDGHVRNLRDKLGDGASMIATVWGVGYKFVEVPPHPE